LPFAASTPAAVRRTVRHGQEAMHGTRESSARSSVGDEVAGGNFMRRDALPAALVAAPTQLAAALSRSDAGSREEILTRLQAAGGNQEIGRLIQAAPAAAGPIRTVTETVRYPFTATIRRAPQARPPSPAPAVVPSRSDKPPGAEGAHEQETLIEKAPVPQPGAVASGAATGESGGGGATPAGASASQTETPGGAPAQTEGGTTPAPAQAPAGGGTAAGDGATPAPAQAPAGGSAVPAAATGPPTKLPDIELPALAEVERCDTLVTALTYSGSITKGGAQPDGFGVTRSFSSTLKDPTFAFGPGVYFVTATLEHPITYQIRSSKGPDGQTNVGSDADSAITAANYATVATDLTPNMSDLNGRPPRSSYWAEDLTVKHELVHANDDKGNGPLAMTQVMGWLNGQTVNGPTEVVSLLVQVPKRFAANLLAALSTEAGEKHAYGDGAPSYKARADSISAKGAKGDYH
jgi:hypothetical protein